MSEPTTIAPGTFAPNPRRASLLRMIAAQTRMELLLLLRNGEQVLLSLVVPLGMLIVFTEVDFINVKGGGGRADFFVPGILTLAVISAAFTGQAIATGFDRQYGVLKRLGATALPRVVLMVGKCFAVLAIELLQVTLICLVGLLLGWKPHGDPFSALLIIGLATAAFSGLAFLIAGTLRAMATLALANIIWFILLIFGGVAFPLSDLGNSGKFLEFLPSGALSEGLRAVLSDGHGAPLQSLLVLAAWAVVALSIAVRTFRWE